MLIYYNHECLSTFSHKILDALTCTVMELDIKISIIVSHSVLVQVAKMSMTVVSGFFWLGL